MSDCTRVTFPTREQAWEAVCAHPLPADCSGAVLVECGPCRGWHVVSPSKVGLWATPAPSPAGGELSPPAPQPKPASAPDQSYGWTLADHAAFSAKAGARNLCGCGSLEGAEHKPDCSDTGPVLSWHEYLKPIGRGDGSI